ncbi:diacylglycerol kinase [Agrobacterium rubi TR3 = NBRC 13261]|uniref:Diacylglycerol kinase n=1 Tax=Agrobacterium rubi TR3 = NBRC 13261 TaxID=1368415 RepID=A0A081CVP3_9HYPH|nr:diacylglycerol kinase [Agrobacterium rubi]MBP1877702.1 diacylglycerol kinase (ATP) [Agrobacterium rubi]MCL6652106.1 diacylglycerol kinase [Agrobacterium rubi]GAK70739.1 diacylglycerol kinase [Agrobacterium rubi TR3 = NBRC 13261]
MDKLNGTPSQKPVFEKETGFRHLFAAARYSAQGLARLWKEAAFRHEVLAFGAGLVLLGVIGAPFAHYMIFSGLTLVLFAVEALNTAIEEIVDRVSPEFSSAARHAKDLGSFAVFCMLLANGGFVLYSVISTFFMSIVLF